MTTTATPERVLATEHGLVESESMAQARKEKIGANEIPLKKRATTEDDMGSYLKGEFVEKKELTDSETREMAVAEIDEKLFELSESGANSTEAELLQRVREYLVDLPETDDAFWMQAQGDYEKYSAEKDTDKAGTANVTADMLADIAVRSAEDGGAQQLISEHNQRIKKNAEQRKVIEQRNRIATINTRS